VLFIGLNPSTADHRRDDPTIRRCLGFARDWGFGRLTVVNLFAFRSASPQVLRIVSDPIGPANDAWILRLAHDADLVVAAWGVGVGVGLAGGYCDRATMVTSKVGGLYCLGRTSDGSPRHPLYVRRTVLPQRLIVGA
jgi:hypothetical protein